MEESQKITQPWKANLALEVIIPANQREDLRGDLTTESMVGFWFAKKAKLRYNKFSWTRAMYEEPLSDMVDCYVFFLYLASYR